MLRRSLLALAVIGCGDSPPPELAVVATPPPVAVAVAVAKPKPPAPPAAKPKRVVIISIDGLRPDMMTADLMPRHVQLMREGTTARDAWTIQESDTLPSHAAMLSGVGMSAHGLSWNSYQANRGYIKVPTIFTAARAAGLSTAMIVGKPKLKHIASPGTVDHFERPSYLCGGVAKRAAEYSPPTIRICCSCTSRIPTSTATATAGARPNTSGRRTTAIAAWRRSSRRSMARRIATTRS